MTAAQTIPQIPVRLDFDARAAGFSRAMAHLDRAATKELDQAGIDPRLRELVRIRASQLNGCAYCIDMHSKDARSEGESEQRLYTLSAWRETPFFTERERAALAWTEAITLIGSSNAQDEVYEGARKEFSEEELVNLTIAIVAINGWNRLAIGFRSVPGTYQPGEKTAGRANP